MAAAASSTTPVWKHEHVQAALRLSMFAASGNLAAAVPGALEHLLQHTPVHAVFDVLHALHAFMHGKTDPTTNKVVSFALGEHIALANDVRRAWVDNREASGAAALPLLQRKNKAARAFAFVVAFNGKHVPNAHVVRELDGFAARDADDTTFVKVLRGVQRNPEVPLYWEHGQWIIDDLQWVSDTLRAAAHLTPMLLYQAVCNAGLSGPRFHSKDTRFAPYPFHNTGLLLAYARSLEAAHDDALA